jgi:hypothetical protein
MVVSYDVPSTTNTATEIVWTALTGSSTGGAQVTITQYEVYWEISTGSWASLANTSSLAATQTGLTGGATYSYMVRAYNKYGAGPFTSPISMQTSQAPDQPAAPVVVVVGGYVNISWTAPFANYRPVLAY